MHDPNDLMFIHIRDIPEIRRMVKKYPCIKTLLVKNDRVKIITSNVADANVEEYNYDFIINNNGTLDELREKAREFVMSLGNID